MFLVDTTVPKANRMDAIAGAFSYKDRWGTQVAILLSTLPLFSKACAYPNDILHSFADLIGFQHINFHSLREHLSCCAYLSHRYDRSQLHDKLARKLFMKIAGDKTPTRNPIRQEEIA